MNKPKKRTWKPTIVIIPATSSVFVSNWTWPIRIGPMLRGTARANPITSRANPGQVNSQRGENSSMNRKCRHPSRHGFRCGGRERPSGCSVTGTSAIRSDRRVALMTISEANSIPVVFSSIFL